MRRSFAAVIAFASLCSPALATEFITNGAMLNDSANQGGASMVYVQADGPDTWYVQMTAGIAFVQRMADAPPGFVYSVKTTVATPPSSVGPNDKMVLFQLTPGPTWASLGYGTPGAFPVSAGFYQKVHGVACPCTFALSYHNQDASRSYVAPYTITAPDAWQFVPILNVPGDVTGNWQTGAGTIGNFFVLSLAGGSNKVTPFVNQWIPSTAPNDPNMPEGCNNDFMLTAGAWSEVTDVMQVPGNQPLSYLQ